MYTDYQKNDRNVEAYRKQEQVMQVIQNRFQTYGYQRIKTPAFERYDLYSQITSSINQNEMIKVIDYTGEVLVLRPDMTIPITRQVAQETSKEVDQQRYFYMEDVYRQPFEGGENIEQTQAGIEYFGERSPEADAEVIALSWQTLTDLGFTEIKIELGHAGFFQELIEMLDGSEADVLELKRLIQTKNVVDIGPYVERLRIDRSLAEALKQIPFLYGNPIDVNERAKQITLTEKMKNKLGHLMKVYEILKIYGIEDDIVMDLGLINHMGYYSDLIFQGFIDKIGKPVVMGGRYDQLANEFGQHIPAIGFACNIDTLVRAKEEVTTKPSLDFIVLYKERDIRQSITIASALRSRDYRVVTAVNASKSIANQSKYIIMIDGDQKTLHDQEQIINTFSSMDELIQLIERGI